MGLRLVPGEHNGVAKAFGVGKEGRLGDQSQNVLIAGDAAGQLDMRALIFDSGYNGFGAARHQTDLICSYREAALWRDNHIVTADKPSNKGSIRGVEHLARWARLLDDRVVHHDNLICQREGFVLPVRHMYEGNPQLELQLFQFGPHAEAEERVQRR